MGYHRPGPPAGFVLRTGQARRTMSRSPRITSAILLALAAAAPAACSSPPEDDARRFRPLAEEVQVGPSARALLVGISDYAEVTPLRGPENDVETMRQLLVTRYGFPPENVTILKNSAATRKRILAGIQEQVDETGPEEVCLFYFSGHGSQAPDRVGGDEEDGWDETLVPYDGRTGTVADITDDELSRLFSNLKTDRAVVILDSCHSGSGSRGIVARSIGPDENQALYVEPEQVGALAGTRGLVAIEERYIVLTASRANQLALDAKIDGRYHGLFSYALWRALARSSPNTTLRELMEIGVPLQMRRLEQKLNVDSLPEPQLESPEEFWDEPLFRLSDREPRLPWAEVQETDAGRGRVFGGAALGATRGSTLAIYPRGELNYRPGQALATARVIDHEGQDAIVELDDPNTSIEPQARAVTLSPPFAGNLTLRLVGAETAQRLESALRQGLGEDVEWTTAADADFQVELEGSLCYVSRADGLEVAQVSATDDARLASELVGFLSRLRRVRAMLSLENLASAITLDVQLAEPPVGSRGVRIAEEFVEELGLPRLQVLADGDERDWSNSVMLKIQASTDCYLTVVDIDPLGGFNLLFPNEVSDQRDFYRDGAILGGEQILIPDSLENGNWAGFHWDLTPPAGLETIRVFASRDLETAQALRQQFSSASSLQDGDSDGSAARERDLLQSLAALRTQLERKTVFDLAGSSQEEPDWAAVSITIRVEE